MSSQIKLRRGTAAQWTSANPVLAQGEAGFETDTYKLKIGNGSSAWNSLTYFSPTPDLSAYLTQASASTTYATITDLENIDLSSASAAAVAYLVDGAPGALDTLNELAAALNDDASFATTVTNSITTKQSALTTYQAVKETQQTFGESGAAIITGLSASVTTTSSGQKVLINASIPGTSLENYRIQLRRDTAALNTIETAGSNFTPNGSNITSFTYLDSPGVGTFVYDFYLSFNYSSVYIPSNGTAKAVMTAVVI